jgi:hypothetical protein
LATVTSIAPLEVRRDGDITPVPAVETNVTVTVSDRVLTETVDQQVYIIVEVV